MPMDYGFYISRVKKHKVVCPSNCEKCHCNCQKCHSLENIIYKDIKILLDGGSSYNNSNLEPSENNYNIYKLKYDYIHEDYKDILRERCYQNGIEFIECPNFINLLDSDGIIDTDENSTEPLQLYHKLIGSFYDELSEEKKDFYTRKVFTIYNFKNIIKYIYSVENEYSRLIELFSCSDPNYEWTYIKNMDGYFNYCPIENIPVEVPLLEDLKEINKILIDKKSKCNKCGFKNTKNNKCNCYVYQ